MTIREDLYRKYIDWALCAVSEYRSPQTGYVHVHPDLYKGKAVQAVPTYENFLFVLLLFRKKSVEYAKEARTLLKRLLEFQEVDEGNFPFFLTEFPSCRDKHLPFRLLPVFSSMLNECAPLVGKELFSALQEAHVRLLACAEKISHSTRLPAWAAFVLQEDVQSWNTFIDSREWMNPSILGNVLLSLHSSTRFNSYLEKAESLWEGRYLGPAWGAFQFGGFPEVTVFDCLMSLYTCSPFERREWSYLTALECARINPSFLPKRGPKKEWYRGDMWQIERFGRSTISCALFTPPVHQRAGFCPIRIVMPTGTISFCLPKGEVVGLSSEGSERMCIKVRLGEPSICAYVERAEMGDFVRNAEGSFFDPFVGIRIGDITLGLCETPMEAIGSIAIGDRPEQRCKNDRGYDWKIVIEPLRGEVPEIVSFWVAS